MKMRKLGKHEVSELDAGCMSISSNYGPTADLAQGIATIRAAHAKGMTFFDTAAGALWCRFPKPRNPRRDCRRTDYPHFLPQASGFRTVSMT
jgi:hypothetical protein